MWLSALITQHRVLEDINSIPGLGHWVKDLVLLQDVGLCGSDLALLCLWHKPAIAAWILPIAQEIPYAAGVALKKKKKCVCVCVCIYIYIYV